MTAGSGLGTQDSGLRTILHFLCALCGYSGAHSTRFQLLFRG